MPNMSPKKAPMPTQDPNVRNKNFLEVATGYTQEVAIEEAQRCLNCKTKPCVSGCPVHIAIPDFIKEVANGNFAAAYDVISESAYHESITFTCDSDFLVNDEHHLAGEEITVNADDERFAAGRIYIRPETNLARTSITSIERDQGVPSYRGNFEIAKASEGLLLINELLLEEYLYSVVPSEMPASYPIEALKAQAVSARTYAYQRMVHSGLKEYGAHVDDSAAFQVYNNIKENENTTIAIRETQGQIAMIGESLAETYYYSTSCGFGTDPKL